MFFVRRNLIGCLFICLALFWVAYDHYQNKLAKQQHAATLIQYIEQIKNSDYSSVTLEKLSILDPLDPAGLEQGKREMLKNKIVIVGIIRDNVKDLLVSIKHIEHLGSFFKDYRVIIFENDSADGTTQALNAWQANNKVKIISKIMHKRRRINHEFMADIRNQYLETLKNSEYSDFDIVAVLDMDMSFGFDLRGIVDSFSKIEQWEGICSNGIYNSEGKMYDAFAFRNVEFPFAPHEWQMICTHQDPANQYSKLCDYSASLIHNLIAFRTGFQSSSRLYWLKIIPQIQKYYPVNTELIPVYSCFGGMAFYKKQFIGECKYYSLNNDCEHVYFHKCMRKNQRFRMMMNPSQIIRYSHYVKE